MKNIFRKKECDDKCLRKMFFVFVSSYVENIFRKHSFSHLLFKKIFFIIQKPLTKIVSIIQKVLTENVFHNIKISYGKCFS